MTSKNHKSPSIEYLLKRLIVDKKTRAININMENSKIITDRPMIELKSKKEILIT